MCGERVREQFVRVGSLLPHAGPRDGTQVVRLASM